MALTVKVNDGGLRIALGKAATKAETRSVHRVTGEVMRSSITDTFDQEGFPRGAWRRLNASTLAQQFTRGGKRKVAKKRGGQTVGFTRFVRGKKILTDKRRLANSITYKSSGKSLVIGTSLIYARVHQEGAVIKPKTAKALRIPIGGGKVIFRKRVVIPARPFLLIKPHDPADVGSAVAASIAEPLKGRRS